MIYHQRPLCVDTVDLLVLFIFLVFYFSTTALASTQLDANDISSGATSAVDTIDLSSTSTFCGRYLSSSFIGFLFFYFCTIN